MRVEPLDRDLDTRRTGLYRKIAYSEALKRRWNLLRFIQYVWMEYNYRILFNVLTSCKRFRPNRLLRPSNSLKHYPCPGKAAFLKANWRLVHPSPKPVQRRVIHWLSSTEQLACTLWVDGWLLTFCCSEQLDKPTYKSTTERTHCFILHLSLPTPIHTKSSFASPISIMTVTGGTYIIVNAKGFTALDLSKRDQKTVIGYPLHGKPNQRVWHFILERYSW